MEPGTILIKEPSVSPKKSVAPAPELGWYLLGWAGWVFLLAGLVDIGLAWVPFHLGNPEWEFGTVTQSLQSLPVPFLGAALIIAAGIARGKLWWARLGVIVLAVLALWVIVSGVLYALNVPLALRAVKQPQILFGLKKAIFRTAVQVGLYAVAASGMVWLGVRTLKAAARATPESR
jgi:hypothetical protein